MNQRDYVTFEISAIKVILGNTVVDYLVIIKFMRAPSEINPDQTEHFQEAMIGKLTRMIKF